jgi:hypothetical protein
MSGKSHAMALVSAKALGRASPRFRNAPIAEKDILPAEGGGQQGRPGDGFFAAEIKASYELID